jgi:excinuclease ABC subunit C
MKAEAIAQNFERAAKIRNRISSLERVLANARIFEKQTVFEEWNKTQKIIQNITGAQNEISKIEAYDISNIQGQTAAGSMVVFINGAPDKSQYRKFKIRGKFTPYRPESGRRTGAGPDDISMLKEVLQRRFGHPEWRFPDLILIDGGRAQLNAALSARGKLKFLAASLAKKKNELYIESRRKPLLLLSLPRPIYNLILQLRDEAHRFAISYHRKLRKKNVFV